MKLSDKIAKEALTDHIDFKLIIAKNFLDKIITSVPYDRDSRHFQLEFSAEGFLIFSNMVIEILSQEINQKFQLFSMNTFNVEYINDVNETFDEHDKWILGVMNKGGKTDSFYPNFTIYKIRYKLTPSDQTQKQIIGIIDNYFSMPKKTGRNWDLSKSSLWQLREIRNHVSHQYALNLHFILGQKAQYVFRFVPDKTTNEQVAIVINDPQKFFYRLYDDLVKFRNEIRQIIPYKMPSSHYKNQLEFGLKF